jgi:hypothetical protein
VGGKENKCKIKKNGIKEGVLNFNILWQKNKA